MFKSKLKSIAFLISILVLAFTFGYFIFAAWTDAPGVPPTCPAGYPGCDAPLNVSSNPQAKPARLTFTEFYDYNNSSYYVNPAGQSVLSDIKIGNFRFYPISATELGIYDSVGNLILILD